MSELTKRIAFAGVAIPVVFGIMWMGGAALVALLALAAGLAAYEFYRLAIAAGSVPLWGHGVILSALIPLFVHARHLGLWTPGVSIVMLVVLELLTVALWARGIAGKPLEVVGITLLGVFYTGGMLSFGYALRYQRFAVGAAAGAALVAFPLVLTWATDTGGFFFGKAFGKRKLMEAISPNKTVAGAVGGLAMGIFVSAIFAAYVLPRVAHLAMSPLGALLFGAVVSTMGQVGDLVESMLKRQAGVKDSSNLIPGHGGALDRVDSLLFTLPIAYVLLDLLLVPAP